MKLILFGDSHLAKFKTKYIKKVEKSVNGLDIYNYAFGGAASTDGMIKSNYISNLKPDVMFLSFGTNDLLKGQISIEEYVENMKNKILSTLISRP